MRKNHITRTCPFCKTEFIPTGIRKSFCSQSCAASSRCRKQVVLSVNDNGTASVPLSRGLKAIIDAEDIELVRDYKWHAAPAGKTCYAITRRNYKRIKLHRLIMQSPDDRVVDHIDGNGLNNVKSNLRIVTQSQNCINRRPSCRTLPKSGYRGVYPSCNRWRALIRVDGKTAHLGTFDTKIEAAHAYDDKAREIYQDCARLNFPLQEDNSEPSTHDNTSSIQASRHRNCQNRANRPEQTGNTPPQQGHRDARRIEVV